MSVLKTVRTGAINFFASGVSGPWDLISDYPFSLNCWIYPSNSLLSDQVPFGYGNNNGTADFHVIFYDATNGFFSIASRRNGGSFVIASETSGNSPKENWYNISCVFYSETSRKLYKSGVEIASSTASVTYTQASFDTIRVGAIPISAGSSNGSDCLIAYPSVYNRALTTHEMIEIKNKPYSIVNGLVSALLTTKEVSLATDIMDISGNGYNGTSGTLSWSENNGPPVYFPQEGTTL